MSEQLGTDSHYTVTDNDYKLMQTTKLFAELDADAGAMDLGKGQRFELLRVMAEGETQNVVRFRHDGNEIEGVRRREDVYFSVVDLGHPVLLMMRQDLSEENDLIDSSNFAAIKPLHLMRARKVAGGLHDREVKLGESDDITQFFVAVHEAVSKQKELRGRA